MGLLDGILGASMDDPRTAATLTLAQGLLSSPKAMQGLSGGLLGYQQAVMQAKQQKAAEEMRAIQMQHMAFQFQEQKRAAEQSAMDRALTQKAFTPVQPVEANAASGITGPRPQALGVVGQQPAFDPRQYIASGGSAEKAFTLQQALRKEQPKLSKMEAMQGPNGQLVNVAVFEDGTTKILPYGVKPEMVFQDLGGKVAALNKNAIPNGMMLDKSASPDALFSGGVTMRGQNMTDARARELNAITREGQMTQVVNDETRGTQLVNKATGLMRPALGMDGKPVASEGQAKSAKQTEQLNSAIGEARKLLGQSPTASGAGALTDAGLGFLGVSTGGADVAAKLDTLSGWMTANVPRMEGPQSNFDAQTYKTMAGMVGDRTKPLSQRLAALDTLEGIQQKYAGINGGASALRSASPIPGVRFLGFEGQ